MTLEIFLCIITACYLVEVALFASGLKKLKDSVSDAEPFISVVIAARNEEDNLRVCLTSVARQTYPAARFEVIIIDDNSTDGTQAIGKDFEFRFGNVRVFQAVEGGTLRGKANALAQAIERARGDVILITDADCEVANTWVEYTAKRYANDVGLVGGMTLQKSTNGFEGMQSLDWAYILGVAASTAALGNPLGSIGNNLSFRRQAYDTVGGYRNMKFSVTEDYTLVQSIIKTRRWRYLYPIDPAVLVESKPCPSLLDLFRQKHRWGKGGLDMKLSGFVIMAIAFTLNASAFGMLFWSGMAQCVAALMLKSIADYFFLHAVLRRLGRTQELRYFWWFELYFTLYVLILPFAVFLGGPVVWKGRTY